MKLWMAPAGLHIELGVVSDADRLAKLHAGAFYRGWPSTEFAAYLADPSRTPTYVVANSKRKVEGFAMLRLAADEAELITIIIDPKRRGKGIGAALLRAAMDDLTMTPVVRLFLEVEDANMAAISLYRGLGFDEISRREGYYSKPGGDAATALVMRRELD